MVLPACALSIFPGRAEAQGFSPELSVAFLGVVSLDVSHENSSDDTTVGIGFGDTGLAAGARVMLRREIIAGVDVGMQFPDDGENQGEVFFQLARVTLQNRWLDIVVGRTDVDLTIIRLPTLRDDDLIRFQYVQNPFSDGVSTQDQQYGNVVKATLWHDFRYYLHLHAEHLLVSDPALSSSVFEINALGAMLGFTRPMFEQFEHVLRTVGVAMEAIRVNVPGQEWAWNVYGGFSLYPKPDPIHRVSVDGQLIYNSGIEGQDLVDVTSLSRIRSISSVGSVNYVYYKQESPRVLAALAYGHRAFFKNARGVREFTGIANAFYRLGSGFDLGAQYQVTYVSSSLQSTLGASEYTHTLQFALRAAFNFTMNQILPSNADANRNTPLNVNDGYLTR